MAYVTSDTFVTEKQNLLCEYILSELVFSHSVTIDMCMSLVCGLSPVSSMASTHVAMSTGLFVPASLMDTVWPFTLSNTHRLSGPVCPWLVGGFELARDVAGRECFSLEAEF